jgi:cytochrome b involved in lipid metabolism
MNKKIILIIGIVVVVGIGIFLGTKNSGAPNVTNDIPAPSQKAVSADSKDESVRTRMFLMSDVATHNTPESCYAAINGFVYDLTAWISQHPGGEENILRLCGTDGTAAFTKKHGMNEKAKDTLEGFRIGTLGQ